MTVATLVVRWVAGDATRVSLTLAAALGIEVRPGQPIAIPGLLLEITGREPGAAGRGGDRLEVVVADPKFDAAPTAEDQAVRTQAPASGERAHAVAADGGTGDVVSGAAAYAATAAGSLATGDDPGTAASEGSGVRSLALGWATVDLDRAAAGWPGIAWIAASRDSLVGASALVGELALAGSPADGTGTTAATPSADARADTMHSAMGAAPTIVLLEPDTEGRLAAALARHGEGPAAVYITLPVAASRTAMARLAVLGARVSSGPGAVRSRDRGRRRTRVEPDPDPRAGRMIPRRRSVSPARTRPGPGNPHPSRRGTIRP